MGMTTNIVTERDAGVLMITLNRVNKKNALNQAMYQALAETLNAAADNQAVRVVLITGVEDCFCSGNDLADFANFMSEPEKLAGSENPTLAFMLALEKCPKPVVAAVSGPAVGIGTTMLLHCDLVYCAENTAFSLPFVNLGLRPEYASSYLLPRLAGHARAAEWILLGEPFGAEAAYQAGLVNGVVDDPLLKAREVCHKLAAQAPIAVREAKALLKLSGRKAVSDTLNTELQSFVASLSSPEFGEAVTAFFEKRPADFSKI